MTTLIAQRNRAHSALRRLLTASLRQVTRPVHGWLPQSHRRSPAPVVRVIREPESAWLEQYDEPDTAVTVAVVGETETRRGADAVISRLAELASRDELLIVYGSGAPSQPGHQAVLAGLRGHLPRHHLITMHLDHPHGGLRRDAAVALEQFLEDGSLPMVVTPAAAVPSLAAEISSYLQADRVLRVSGTTSGAYLHQVWRRPAMVGVS